MNCTHILLAVSILAAVCCFGTGHIGPALVTVVSLAAVYMYRYKDHMLDLFPRMSAAAAMASVKAKAEETGTKGVCKSLISRQSRNHRPGKPPPRDGKMPAVLPTSAVSSEGANFIRRRQVGVFM